MAKRDRETEAANSRPDGAADSSDLDASLLKNLTFRSSEERLVDKEGRKVKVFAALERRLEVSDVLSWKDCGSSVIIVTADGRKISISKKEK